MNFDGFTPHEFTRFGGLVDNDDPTVLPMGVAAVCKNCRFQLTTRGHTIRRADSHAGA